MFVIAAHLTTRSTVGSCDNELYVNVTKKEKQQGHLRFKMAVLGILLVLLSSAGVAITSDCYSTSTDYNYKYSSLTYKTESFSCSKGCCEGYHGYYYCCVDGGLVAGIVIGSLVGVALFVALFVFIFVYCMNANRRSMPGRVIGKPVTGRVIRSSATRPQITCINTYSVQPGYVVQPGMQPYHNLINTPEAFTA